MTSAFMYLRVSGKGQIRGDGFLRQFIACRKHAEINKLNIVGIFKERGVSGTKELEDRPALSRLFAALEENGVKVVIVEKLDRLARDLMIQESIVADMLKNGYTLLSAMEPDLCSTDPSRVLIRQIFGIIAQYEKSMLVIKLRGARERKRIQNGGKCEGRKSYGHTPNEQSVLEQIYSLRAQGLTPDQIAETLNQQGVPSRMGKKWRGGTVAKILARSVKLLPATEGTSGIELVA